MSEKIQRKCRSFCSEILFAEHYKFFRKKIERKIRKQDSGFSNIGSRSVLIGNKL